MSVAIANAVFDAREELARKLDALISLGALHIDHLERIDANTARIADHLDRLEESRG